jgi:RNA polymerase sigma-70 factor, ECF subfamily
MKTDPEIELMLRFKNGDERAFQRLFTLYRKPMVNFCYRFCGDRAAAEDLAQDVFIRVYRAAGGYEAKARFSTWIYRIAVNVCLNEFRSRKRKPVITSMDQPAVGTGDRPAEYPDHRTPSADEALAAGQRDEWLRAAFQRLPERQRMALMLRTFHEFSYDEIAGQMMISTANVKTLIFRAREQLKEMLAHPA